MEVKLPKEATAIPTVLVTNEDGINDHGLRILVQVLLSAGCYRVLVCAPDSDQSGVGHGITSRQALRVKPVKIQGAIAFEVTGTPADCASLGVSGVLFNGTIPDLVLSGINVGNTCANTICYWGMVAAAREAVLQGVPSIALSYGWRNNISSTHDLKLAAESCLPIISSVLNEIKHKTFPPQTFLNINVPTSVSNHKGFRLATKQGKFNMKIGYTQTSSVVSVEGDATADMHVINASGTERDAFSSPSQEQFWLRREILDIVNQEEGNDIDTDIDYKALQAGYIAITPLGALSSSEAYTVPYFRSWLQRICPYHHHSSYFLS
ncbi:hypothetical protein J5N97_010952 [Dioscorea zingiberensis]|uniref:Survival protein SurE-like phosphatase/nucleotidase domain-containing protein n=1 Tax=Dioscorea zingiberensis TaxID=325984 RepID=A0A9D5HP41_9LILI|nr:hypothetical protein J5N97_010952 [Dioscorea zingiberensis]